MTVALWIKHRNALVPGDPATKAVLDAIKPGDNVLTSLPRQPRHPEHHKLIMAILQVVVEHCWPRFADIAALLRYLKLKSNMVDYYQVVDGVLVMELKSISFASMDEAEFKSVSEQWRGIICEELMPGVDPEQLLREAA